MSKSEETILIAEDDPLIRKATAHYLAEKGYIILEAGNGDEALQLFREKNLTSSLQTCVCRNWTVCSSFIQ